MKPANFIATIVLTVFLSNQLYSQGTVRGVVKDGETNEVLSGALVTVKETATGVITDINGTFMLKVPEGKQTIIFVFLGFEPREEVINVEKGRTINLHHVLLKPMTFGITGIQVVAERARDRETPVAFSSLSKAELQQTLGSRDLPLSLNITPNVYSTTQGGGAGDARVNIRGFNQSNVAIMINGIPINDMENGWVYWSNWDGIGDAASSLQLQRGLSAINLATPSIGGTINVITDPARRKAGFVFRQEGGSGQFMKSTLYGHTGLIDERWALSAGVVRKVGNGIIDATWTDAWAYYMGATYILNKNNRFEFYAMGAPQYHGQNAYMQNIAAYSQAYAKSLGFTPEALQSFPEANAGRFYNQNWNAVNPTYSSRQWWNGAKHVRHSPVFMNERENYYHKPLVSFNWYSKLGDAMSLFTTVYYSGGKGGGTGTHGSMVWDTSGPSRIVDWDATIGWNKFFHSSRGILRNSVNNQWSVGTLSKLKWRINDNISTSFGIDVRTAEVQHYREIRDLLGGSYFFFDGNQFDQTIASYYKGIGHKIDYDFTNSINWAGAYAQGEYKTESLTGYAMAGYSIIDYKYVNHFVKATSGLPFSQESGIIGGYQVKGGGNYNISETLNAYVNLGYVSKVPIFDAVIDDRSGSLNENPVNETFTSFELGSSFKSFDGKLWLNANGYYTMWNNRSRTISVILQNGNEGLISLTGMDQLHYGVELEGSYQPVSWLILNAAGSINHWSHASDASGKFKDWSDPNSTDTTYNYYVKVLMIGDAPQTQGVLGVTFIHKGLRCQLVSRHYAHHYADWDPFSRTDPADGNQVWMLPNYSVFDLHASFDIPYEAKVNFQIFAHAFNILDKIYVQDAEDNSAFNGFYGPNNEFSHTAMSAEVFLGTPRMVNVGLLVTF